MASRYRSNIRLSEACARYLERITAEGQADTTIRTTGYALERLKKSLAGRRGVLDPYVHTITPEKMDDYCFGSDGLRSGGRPITASTFNRYRSSLKVFFDYAVLMRWTDASPMDGVSAARAEAPRARLLLSAGELLSLLDHCTNPIQRIGCSIGMNTGLRGNDIRRLTVFDANLGNGVLQTEIRKTKKIDNKPITMDLHFELSRWLNEYAALMNLDDISQIQDDWLLVPSYRARAPKGQDRRIKPHPTEIHQNPWRLVQAPLLAMGYPTKGEGFHTLRRSSARALFESLRAGGEGYDHALMVVQQYLNHENIIITQRYLGLNAEKAIRDTLLKGKPFLSALAQTEQNETARRETA